MNYVIVFMSIYVFTLQLERKHVDTHKLNNE